MSSLERKFLPNSLLSGWKRHPNGCITQGWLPSSEGERQFSNAGLARAREYSRRRQRSQRLFMSFKFKRKESVTKGIRRISTERLDTALENFGRANRSEAVHSVRKDIKKLRALLRLARPHVAKRFYRKSAKKLRKAAHRLASARDAHVTGKALDDLVEHFEDRLAPKPFPRLRNALHRESRQETRKLGKGSSLEDAKRRLRQLRRRLKGLELDANEWKALAPGIESNYRRGRKALKIARRDPTPENFHEWRKRTKDLWYQFRLLCPVWPPSIGIIADQLKSLSDYLGDDHDLFLLNQALAKHGSRDEGIWKEAEALAGLIDLRQRELRAAALALGTRLYAEKPSRFNKRLGAYWQIWRNEAVAAQDPEQLALAT